MEERAERPARRRRSKQERRAIVEETLQPGRSVARVARTHGVNANQVFHWRKLYREGLLKDDSNEAGGQWLPVRLADVAPEEPHESWSAKAGVIQVELPRGRVRIEGAVDAAALRLVLESLGG